MDKCKICGEAIRRTKDGWLCGCTRQFPDAPQTREDLRSRCRKERQASGLGAVRVGRCKQQVFVELAEVEREVAERLAEPEVVVTPERMADLSELCEDCFLVPPENLPAGKRDI